MQYLGFEAYEKSINHIDSTVFFMANIEGKTVIIIAEQDSAAAKTGAAGFTIENLGSGISCAELTHENACVLRKLFPWTAPVRGLGKPKSFGLGDRLGIAAPGHIDLFITNDIFPVFAQQSIRELTLTNRTYEDVLDAATFAVFREGYKKGFGADGDHLKTEKDVEYALSLGFTMITLDCSDYIKNENVITDSAPIPSIYKEKYLNKTFSIEDFTLVFSEEELGKCLTVYAEAVNFAASIYNKFFTDGKYNADLEISIDETASVTTPLQHFFVARELLDAGVLFATIAPRFCGEFQKGIDYIGDITQFEKEIKVHAAIARSLNYKLSIHSGSDKFSVFPVIGRETKGQFHVKTAGTNWLEAMRVVAVRDPVLYREVHSFALTVFGEAKKYYQVTADLSNIPDISEIEDVDLPGLFNNNETRQLIHITYGLILNHKNENGSFAFKDRLYNLWKQSETEYRRALVKHIGRHLELLSKN
ncbi:MAG: tagaturonate epimerase family protein [Treponema sp.]|nr:tagaturonate epimerase family protein [Treponema sp.]